MCFGERVSQLIIKGNRTKVKSFLQKRAAHKMTIELNVFNTFIEDVIMCNMNHTLIVPYYRRVGCTRNTNIL